jgi:Na+/H+ antiporter NhaD/arsenite permease-like protein
MNPAQASALPVWWSAPFAGLLLSIAVLPLVAPVLWRRHFGKIAASWALAFALPFAVVHGAAAAGVQLAHALVEYLPFIIVLTALFTVSGGIQVCGNLRGSPGLNTAILAIGAALASLMGTTGASMLLIRPLIRANDHRRHTAHVVVFFIFIVSNVGGALTPLGDPPLFLGFLQGVDFTWTLRNLLPQTVFMAGLLLALFYALDTWYFRHDELLPFDPTPDTSYPRGIAFAGAANFWLLTAIVFFVLLSGVWKPQAGFEWLGVRVGLAGLVRDLALIAIVLISLRITAPEVHAANQFGWGPMLEVGKLFAAIFVTIAPVITMLQAGAAGPFGGIVSAVTRPDGQPDAATYFWATGLLSSWLDNAPAYLVFFNLAGGDAQTLMTAHAQTLAAISIGAVFMGANTYIGNAPNLMVKAIAESRGLRMPGFFGYMLWSGGILVPLFVVVTFIFFHPS